MKGSLSETAGIMLATLPDPLRRVAVHGPAIPPHSQWTAPDGGVIDTYGLERMHPIREGRSPQQIGRQGLSNHRWIVGGKLCQLLNQYGCSPETDTSPVR